jgi:hypothetical protein
MKGTTAQTGAAEHCWVRRLAGRSTQRRSPPLRDLAPRLGVPGLETFWGGFCRFAPNSSKYVFPTLSTSAGPAQASSNLRPPLQLRWNDLGGYPCRRRDLWPHSGILLTCSGAACFQNMEVRVLSRACQGKGQSRRPAGACQSGRRSKDVTTWRWMGSVKLVVSVLPSAFRLLSVGMRTKKQPMRHHALLPQKFRWHEYGKPEVRVDSTRKV